MNGSRCKYTKYLSHKMHMARNKSACHVIFFVLGPQMSISCLA